MGTNLILVILALLVITVLVLPLLSSRRRKGLTSRLARYQSITSALVTGDLRQAREELKEIIRADTDDVGAYLKLARILRREGDVERAVAVCRSLIARQIRDRDQKREVLAGLVEDLTSLKRFDEARPVAELLRRSDRHSPLPVRLQMHEALAAEDWEGALKALDALERSGGLQSAREGSQIRAWIARVRGANGELREARHILEEIARHDPEFGPAWVLLGDFWVRDGEHERAVEVWTRFLRRRPHAAAHLIDRLEKAYFELGRFGDLERFYEDFLLEDGQQVSALRLAMARIALRRGDPGRGLAQIEELLQRDPENRAARWWRLFLMAELGRNDEVRQLLKETAVAAVARPEYPTCAGCGRSVESLAMRCPACAAWLPDPFVGAPAGEGMRGT